MRAQGKGDAQTVRFIALFYGRSLFVVRPGGRKAESRSAHQGVVARLKPLAIARQRPFLFNHVVTYAPLAL